MTSHSPIPRNLAYQKALHQEHHLLEKVDVPIITVSATFRHQLEANFNEDFPEAEVTFSRAHYSMALALLLTALQKGKSAWLTDPTNYVTPQDWGQVASTHTLAKLIARNLLLKELKDLIDTQLRSKFPLTDAIDDPLIYLTQKVQKPIISFHYEAGNILAAAGHTIIQAVTDPHVRPQYLNPLPDNRETRTTPGVEVLDGRNTPGVSLPKFCVFDEATKTEFLLLADELGKKVYPNQIIVTGPPIDPRIVKIGQNKLDNINRDADIQEFAPGGGPPPSRGRDPRTHNSDVESHNPLRLVITTGGLGQNKPEIKSILNQLKSYITQDSKPAIELMLYAGTHPDFVKLYQTFNQAVRRHYPILYAKNIAAANELLINDAFPWADGFITKPSGDMVYDAAAAGCFCLFLQSWGEWEDAILNRFETLGVGTSLDTDQVAHHLKTLNQPYWQNQSWYNYTQKNLLSLPPLFTSGCDNILKLI